MKLVISKIALGAVLLTNLSAVAQTMHVSTQATESKPAGVAKVRTNDSVSRLNNEQGANSNAQTSAMLSDGGVGTGGGNRLSEYNVGSEKVAELIKKSKLPVKYALRSLEMFFEFWINHPSGRMSMDTEALQRLPAIKAKLFGGKITVYDALEKAVLQPQMTGPCLDRAGQAMDGSAKDAPNLCFSVERLGSLSEDSAQREIIALVAHEVSHMMGTEEDEAIILQHMVRSNLSRVAIDKIPDLVGNFASDLTDAINSVQSLKLFAKQGQKDLFCSNAGMFYSQLNTLISTALNSGNEYGISYVSVSDLKLINAAFLKSLNVVAYCMGPQPGYQKLRDAFKGRSEMSADELYRAIYAQDVVFGMSNLKIRNIKNGNGSLTAELNDIANILTLISKNL